MLKLFIIGLVSALVFFFSPAQRKAQANASGPPSGRTGAPGELTCATSDCHRSFALDSGPGTLTLTGLPTEGYSPGQVLTLTVTLAQSGRQRFGFQVTALDDQNRFAGTLAVTESGRTQLINGVIGGNLRRYINHRGEGIFPSSAGQNVWTFRWTAPAQSVGRVTFYVAGNAANGDGNDTGDYIYTRTFSVQPVAAPQAVATVSAASFAQGGASEAIVALFAAGGLTDTGTSATTQPLPTELGGVRVRVRDAAGTERDAPLFFVSSQQINFIVPQGTSNGTANITVLRNNTAVGVGTLAIDTVLPGLFSANSNGQGVPAAVAVRVAANGQQTLELISQFNQTANRFEPKLIDLGPTGETVILVLFGTGFRRLSALSNVTCTIGGVDAAVGFAGAQGDLAGLDQANVTIPRSLAGRNATLDLVFRVDGKNANTVQIAVR